MIQSYDTMRKDGRYSMQYTQTAIAKLENVRSSMQPCHAVGVADLVTAAHKSKKRCTRVEPALQCSCCSLLPTTANTFLDPSHFVDHEAQAIVPSTLSTRDAILNGPGVLLQLRQYENLDLKIHVCGRGNRSSRYLVEGVFGVTWIVGCCDARVEHGNVNSLVPLSADPARMNCGSDGVGIVAIDTCTP